MNTREIKAKISNSAEQIESSVAALTASLGNGAEAPGNDRDELQENLREIGRKLLDSAQMLTDEATKQARLRPLAVFGVAFIAGIVVARTLRR